MHPKVLASGDSTVEVASPATRDSSGMPTGRALYTLFILSLVSLLNYYDRNLINILIEPIKIDLHLTDSQLGIVTGTAFGIVYCAVAIPIGRLADRRGRLKVLVVALAFWSTMTGVCGLARNFAGLVGARCGVGLGEAAGLPTTHALIAEQFSPRWRSRALSVIAVMSAFGAALASGVGSAIADRFGWRAAFFTGAVPGIIIAILMALSFREPSGRAARMSAARDIRFVTAMLILWRRKAFVWLCLGIGVGTIGSHSIHTWIAPFLMRNFHASIGAVGGRLSIVIFVSNVGGVIVGGLLGDFLSKRDRRWPLWFAAICFGIACPWLFYVLSMPTLDAATFVLAVELALTVAITAPIYALVQQLCGDSLRATGSATFLTVANLVGIGGGPLLTGVLSDRLRPIYGDGSLKVGLMLTSTTLLVGAVCFLIASRTVAGDIADAERDVVI